MKDFKFKELVSMEKKTCLCKSVGAFLLKLLRLEAWAGMQDSNPGGEGFPRKDALFTSSPTPLRGYVARIVTVGV